MPAAWNPQANALFLQVLEQPPAERAAFLNRACGDDAALVERVRSLLAASEQAGSFLNTPLVDAPPTIDSPTERLGTRIGPYKLLQQIGEGGFGIVYMAEQEEPVRRLVAVKIIKPGMDTCQVIARFESERQALALMDHPHIARVLDAGATDSGRPYFVMELVKGVPITEFCDQNHMPAEARLKLFIDVCHAIQHAHHKGVIHRDIKPSNVMVTLHDGVPVVKVIDFGVAKATVQRLTEKTLFTAYGQMIGTPAYMSPEQAEMSGLDIDTRSDIYSLGVLFYELLTGTTPLDRKRLREAGYGEMQRMIREEEAPRPSTRLSSLGDSATILAGNRGTDVRRLARLLAGDLDWIAMKALEKDRNRRYGTPANFAEDIERYLRREAILARPPSTSYKLRQFIRRNRGPVIAASLLLAALVAGFVGTTWGLIRAELNARAADRARNDAENRARSEERAKKLAQAATKRAEQEKQRADGKAQEARQALFAARQQVAMNAWRANQADVLADVLQRQKPTSGEVDLRGFEWSYLDRLSRAPGRRWQERGEMVNGVAISPDDRLAITVGFDGKATAWDVATGQKKWDTGTGFRWSVNAAAIAPDGRSIALAGHLGQLQLWNIDGTFRQKLEGHQTQVFGVAFSPDGRWLASAGADFTVRLWEVATGAAAGMLGAPAAGDGRPGPQVIAQTNPAQGVGHTNMVWQAAWAPDSKRLASCSSDGSIKIWAVPEGKLLHTLVGHEGIVIAVAWSPDGRLIAGVSRPKVGAGSGEVKLWNPETASAEATFRPPTGGLHAVRFTPDGLFVVTGGQDHTVRVWRKDGRLVAEHRGLRSEVIGLAIGGGGRWAVAGTSAGEIVALELDALPGQKSVTAGDRTRLAFSADGRLAAFRHGAVHWHDPETLTKISTWPAANVAAEEGDRIFVDTVPVGFALRSDGEAAHSAHYFVGPGTVVWRDATGNVRHLLAGHAAPITAVAFLPGDRLASADEAGAIRIWNGVTGKATAAFQGWDGPVRFLVATAEGHLWAGGAPWAPGSGPDKLHRPTSKEGRYLRIEGEAALWNGAASSVPLAADLSPDGRSLAVGHDDGTLRWLNPRTGEEIRSRTSANGPIVSLRFSPREPRLAVGGADGTVRLLAADSGEELLALSGYSAPVASLVFFPDGRRIAATGASMWGGATTVWDGRPAGDPEPLPAPDAVWHKARLADATDRDQVRLGPSSRDVFAMRRHLERLAALEPGDLQWPRGLLALDQDAGDYRTAATRLEDIVRRWPDDAPMWYDLGNARRELGEINEAKAAFLKCIALDPNFAEAHCNLGLILSREGKHDEAVGPLTRGHQLGLAKIAENQAWPYPSAAWLAATYAALDRQADILQLFQNTLAIQKAKLGPDHLETLFSMAQLAQSLSKLGRNAEAVPLIDEFVERAAGKRVDPNLVVNAIMLRLRHFQTLKDAAGLRATAEMFERLKLSDPGSLYNAACLRAITAAAIVDGDMSETATQQAANEAEQAMTWLRQAVAAGFADAAHLATDKDLDALRERTDFQSLLAALKKPPPP